MSPLEVVARALALEWYRPGATEGEQQLWLVMTASERRRFEAMAERGVEAYLEAVGGV